MGSQEQFQTSGYHANLKAAATISLAIVFLATILVAPALSAQQLNQLAYFTGPNGNAPNGDLTLDAAGNVYGTTFYGGKYGTDGPGTVFKLTRKGSGWIFSSLYDFTGYNDGGTPWGGVIFGPDGALYGTTAEGGRYGHGTVFKLQPPATRCATAFCYWSETVLYSFTGGSDGSGPQGELIFDHAGNLYGTTYYGGQGSGSGNGVVYELSPSQGSWSINALYAFTGGADGGGPGDGVVMDQAGNLYGTATYGGGAHSLGVVYELRHIASGWTETVLHDFTGGADGKFPTGLVLDSSGNVYGGTFEEGSLDGGTAYELQPSGGGFSYNIIYSFDGSTAGAPYPVAAFTVDNAGNLYGTGGGGTGGGGTIYELSPSGGGWNLTVLWNFNIYNGLEPGSKPVLDARGNLYGTTELGGVDGDGVVWELTP